MKGEEQWRREKHLLTGVPSLTDAQIWSSEMSWVVFMPCSLVLCTDPLAVSRMGSGTTVPWWDCTWANYGLKRGGLIKLSIRHQQLDRFQDLSWCFCVVWPLKHCHRWSFTDATPTCMLSQRAPLGHSENFQNQFQSSAEMLISQHFHGNGVIEAAGKAKCSTGAQRLVVFQKSIQQSSLEERIRGCRHSAHYILFPVPFNKPY